MSVGKAVSLVRDKERQDDEGGRIGPSRIVEQTHDKRSVQHTMRHEINGVEVLLTCKRARVTSRMAVAAASASAVKPLSQSMCAQKVEGHAASNLSECVKRLQPNAKKENPVNV